MSLTTKPRSLGNALRFFRSGDSFTLPSAGTAGRGALPGPTDTGWLDLGAVTSLKIGMEGTETVVKKPSPGILVPYDVVRSSRGLVMNATVEDVSLFMFELLFGASEMTNGSAISYGALGENHKQGWIELKQYDQDGVLVNTMQLWADISIEGAVEFGDKNATFDLKIQVLTSTAGGGTILPA